MTAAMFAAIALLAGGCHQAKKQQTDNENIPADSTQADKHEISKGEPCGDNLPMSGWIIEGLAGGVEQVTYTNGDFVKFNRCGNIIEKKSSQSFFFSLQKLTFTYKTPLRYTLQYKIEDERVERTFEIEYNDTMRVEKDRNGISFEYVFDRLPSRTRIAKTRTFYHQGGCETEYIYRDNGFLPQKEIIVYGGETTTTYITSTYEYLKFDKQGNWLQCRKKEKTTVYQDDYEYVNEGDPIFLSEKTVTHTLTRSIKYY
jgi:hypothetical protein